MNARQHAQSQVSSIVGMIRALDCDFDRLEELRESRYVSGFNVPGFMPACAPDTHATFDDAKRDVIWWIKRGEEMAETEGMAERLCAFAESVNLESAPFNLQGPDGLHYWVELNSDDAEELKELEEQAGEYADQDEARDAIHETPLSAEVRGGWHGVGEDAGEPEEFRIVLCTGGPHVELTGDIGGTVRVVYRGWGESGEYYPDADERAALEQFVSMLIGTD